MARLHMRVAPRLPIAIPIRFRVDRPGGCLLHFGKTENLSVGGALIKTEHAPPVASRLHIELALPTLWEPLSTHGEVCWIWHEEETAESGFGMSFEVAQGNGAAALCELLGQTSWGARLPG